MRARLELLHLPGLTYRLHAAAGRAHCTNVPGPPVEIHLAGGPLSEMLVWAPVSGHIGLGVSLLSYAGQVRLGIVADAKRVADPRAIVSAYEAELAAFTSTAS